MRNRAICLQLLCLAAFFLNSSITFAAMYKWVDEEGNTHYSQSPPPGDIKGETIKPPPRINPEYDTKKQGERSQMLDDIQKKREQAREEQLKAEEESAQKQKQCEQARARLASYERPRIMVKDADGNPTRIGEDQRMAELEKSRELVRELCK